MDLPQKIKVIVEMDLKTGEVKISGPLQMTPVVCKALASAIVAAIDFQPPAIQKPLNGNGHLLVPKAN